MKRTIKVILSLCLMLALLAGASNGVSAAPASSVWVNGIELADGDYLENINDTTAKTGATTEPGNFDAWFANDTLTLIDANITRGHTFSVSSNSGACGICADGDLSITMLGSNTIFGDGFDFLAGIAINGNLTIYNEHEGQLFITGDCMGIYSNGGSILIAGNSLVTVFTNGSSSTLNGAIFAENGNVVITDMANVNAAIRQVHEPDFSAGICAYNGNVTISEYSKLNVQNNCNSDQSISIYAGPTASESSGNITCVGCVNVNAASVMYGMYATQDIYFGNSAVVYTGGYKYGLTGMKNLTLDQVTLYLYGSNYGIIEGNPNLILNEVYFDTATYGGSNGNGEIEVEDVSKIGYNNQAGTYIYDNAIEKPIHTLYICPVHECEDFSDCANWGWSAPYNCFVIENNIMGSVNANSKYFDANGTVTRAMVVAVMYRLCGSPALTDADYAAYNNKFTDVKKGDWYYNAVVWGYNEHVAYGMSDTTFDPNGNTTREQIVTFFWRFCDYIGYDNTGDDVLGGYTDAGKVEKYAVPAFQWAVTYGVVHGTSDTELSPKSSCTRGQMATIITNFATSYMADQNWSILDG